MRNTLSHKVFLVSVGTTLAVSCDVPQRSRCVYPIPDGTRRQLDGPVSLRMRSCQNGTSASPAFDKSTR
jgi:hypothetical protein